MFFSALDKICLSFVFKVPYVCLLWSRQTLYYIFLYHYIMRDLGLSKDLDALCFISFSQIDVFDNEIKRNDFKIIIPCTLLDKILSCYFWRLILTLDFDIWFWRLILMDLLIIQLSISLELCSLWIYWLFQVIEKLWRFDVLIYFWR